MATVDGSTLVVITRLGMGHADSELQQKLLLTWLRVIRENGRLPGALVFYSEGVRCAAAGSPFLEDLRSLEREGVHLILCKTCIDAYGLEGSIQVGVVGGMGDIVAAQWRAAKVLHL